MDLLNFSAAERVDLSDLNYVAQDTPLGFAREMASQFALNPSATQLAYVMRGFKATNPTGNQIQVSLGSAFLGRRVGLDVFYGLLTATGEATQSIDVSSFQEGTYGVYIKFDQTLGAQENRTFWQAGETPGEYAQSVPTRLLSSWQMTIVALTPGPEWLQVASLQLPNNTLIDTRPLYFEGQPDQGYKSSWGAGSNDRNADRATYGIGDLQTFTAAMRTALEDVKGPGLTRWWENKIGGQNIGFAGTPSAGRTAWGDTGFYAQGSTTAPSLVFDTGTAATFTRSTQVLGFTLAGNTALSLTTAGAIAPLTLGVGAAALGPLSVSSATFPQFIIDSKGAAATPAQLKLQAASGYASLLWAPGGTTTLFEQRAVPAVVGANNTVVTPANLGFYVGASLLGTVDTNKNWILGAATSGYAYPNATTVAQGGTTVVTATYPATLTVADTSGSHLLRLDTSAASGVPALMSLRANQAATQLRFTPNATSTTATHSFALGASGTTLTLGSANLPHVQINTADNVVDCSSAAGVKAQNFNNASPFYDCYPNVLLGRVGNNANATLTPGPTGGYVTVQGLGNNSGIAAMFPVQVPAGATITSAFVAFFRSSSSSGNFTVRAALWGTAYPNLSALVPVGATTLSTTAQSFGPANAGHTLSLTGINASTTSYYNFFVSFADSDSNAVNNIVSLHVYYTVPTLTPSYV